MPLNPAAYVLTPQEQIERMDARREFEKENNHLALPFHVDGLNIPDQYPGETAIVLARSHEGKSTVMKSWAAKATESVTAKARRAVTVYVSHEDTAEITAEQQISRLMGNRAAYSSGQFLYIGRSFGMSQDDIADMYLTNIARMLQYARDEKFSEPMPFSAVFYDYLQRTPPDPERRKMVSDSQRRMQLADDTTRLCNAAVTFSCPFVGGSQATLKTGHSHYSVAMPIPGPGDTDESKEIYQLPDRVYAYWHVARKYPPGTHIQDGFWDFVVQDNLVFIWVIKVRYYQPNSKRDRFAPIGRVFPLFMNERGDYTYDKDYHAKIWRGGTKP